MTVYQNGGGSSVPPPPPLVCRPHLNPNSPPLLSPLDPASRLSPLHPPFHYEDGAAPPATHAATTPMPVAGEARTCCSGAAAAPGGGVEAEAAARRGGAGRGRAPAVGAAGPRAPPAAGERGGGRGEWRGGRAGHLPAQRAPGAATAAGAAPRPAGQGPGRRLPSAPRPVLPGGLPRGLPLAPRRAVPAAGGGPARRHAQRARHRRRHEPQASEAAAGGACGGSTHGRGRPSVPALHADGDAAGGGACLGARRCLQPAQPRIRGTPRGQRGGAAPLRGRAALPAAATRTPAVGGDRAARLRAEPRHGAGVPPAPVPVRRHVAGARAVPVPVRQPDHAHPAEASLRRHHLRHEPGARPAGGPPHRSHLAAGLAPAAQPPHAAPRLGAPPAPRRAAPACCCCCGGREEVSAREANEGGGAYTVWGEGEGAGEGQVVVWGAGVTVGGVVRVKQVTRTCLNDVLLAAVAGALRLTLQRRGVRHPRDLRASVAVDLRSSPPPFSIPRLGTKAALVPLSLPLSWDAAIPRLWEVRSRVDDMKASAEAVVAYGLVWWACKLLPTPLTRSLLRHLYRRCSVQYSSLPGPTSPLLLGGYTVKHIYNISPPRDPTPLSVTVLTYADQVHVSVAARTSMPAAPAVARLLLQEFQNQCIQMCELLANRRIPGEQRRGMVFTPGELGRGHSLPELQEKLRRVQTELTEVTQLWEATRRNALAHPPRPQDVEEEEQEEGGGASAGSALLGRNSGPGSGAGARGGRGRLPQMEEVLCSRVQHLKGEFTDLLAEIRRRKSVSEGRVVGVGSQTEFEEEDGEVRRPRKRALSAASTWSASSGTTEVSSCLARPLTTPTQPTPTPLPPATHPSRGCLVTDIT
ncbi:uncharacterized protein LOC135091214 [Scylla paramamosain]|uniref:uncharacterized protein LOC135091214 n=1 Tax=Scylla paramamosain TaxID=85552 RepID=UPI0030829CA4